MNANDGILATGDEGRLMREAGLALWDAMAAIVASNKQVYPDVPEPERSACIGRLAVQAFMCAAVERSPTKDGTYVILSSAGRLIGQVVAQSPSDAHRAQVLAFLDREIAIGARDFIKVSTPRGRA